MNRIADYIHNNAIRWNDDCYNSTIIQHIVDNAEKPYLQYF